MAKCTGNLNLNLNRNGRTRRATTTRVMVSRVDPARRGQGQGDPNAGFERRSGSPGPPGGDRDRERDREARRGQTESQRGPGRAGQGKRGGRRRTGYEGGPGGSRARGRRGSVARGRGGDANEPVLVNRSFLLGKPVITRTTGTNLGVVNQMWVDTNEWKVVFFDVRENMFFGEYDSVMLESLKQIGDVILVQNESDAQQHVVVYGLNYLVGSEVVTEVGGYLGKVRDFAFNPEDGQIATIEFDSFGTPVVPSSVLSTYAVNCSEIISVGPDRLVVAAGAESRVQQLSSGVMQRLALYEPPWEAAYREQYEMDYYGSGYALPPFQEQYNQNDYRSAPPQQYRQYNQREPQYMQDRRPPQRERERARGQQSYDDFIEVEEREPVYEAQVQSQRTPPKPQDADYTKYNRDEDRL
ncbi:hypothetical protein A3770_02p19430 [Chloropicon primus]|uniref:PRC-barrel domain-containing protein n=2 Tax=Chloropicon primus TaxID=1764295 RepID=A0A5B8MID7_9CHLO|nr:hypothetical protein A3770_02p19430 [Chloropicon primus]|eukprot:QDZ19425.1 hypothetical protein A3770_02p19430 [Chloropicon primus]